MLHPPKKRREIEVRYVFQYAFRAGLLTTKWLVLGYRMHFASLHNKHAITGLLTAVSFLEDLLNMKYHLLVYWYYRQEKERATQRQRSQIR